MHKLTIDMVDQKDYVVDQKNLLQIY